MRVKLDFVPLSHWIFFCGGCVFNFFVFAWYFGPRSAASSKQTHSLGHLTFKRKLSLAKAFAKLSQEMTLFYLEHVAFSPIHSQNAQGLDIIYTWCGIRTPPMPNGSIETVISVCVCARDYGLLDVLVYAPSFSLILSKLLRSGYGSKDHRKYKEPPEIAK